MTQSYKDAGVDVTAGYQSVQLIKDYVGSTHNKNVLSGLGGFGALFSMKDFMHMQEPILVSGTDGVGTKLKIAFLLNQHHTIGIDCVAMCVNDIICSGAKPLFFLDYIACGKNVPEKIADIVKGVTQGCIHSGCALVGGETAEMPGFYPEEEYDLAGFAVGVVDKPNMINGSAICKGDVLIGIASSGVHSNGFSLVRKIFPESKLQNHVEEFGTTIAKELLTPTKIYVKPILGLMEKYPIKGISHVTGGGFYENLPRMFAENESKLGIQINKGSWPVLPIFEFIKKDGQISEDELYGVFNMGIGMVIAVAPEHVNPVVDFLHQAGELAYPIGEVTTGNGVVLC